MFGDPVRNEKGWDVVSLEKVCNKITDGTHKTPVYQDEGVKFLSAKNIRGGVIDWDKIKYISTEEHLPLIKRCKPELGDIMLSKSGSIGTAVIVDRNEEFSIFESLALLKPKHNLIVPDYLCGLLNNPRLQEKYLGSVKGISIKHLHLEDIRKIKVPLPPIENQKLFKNFVQTLNAFGRKTHSASESSDFLFDAITQRAFRGEL